MTGLIGVRSPITKESSYEWVCVIQESDEALTAEDPNDRKSTSRYGMIGGTILFFLCVGLAGLITTSVYLNHPGANLLRQLCLNSLPALRERAKELNVMWRRGNLSFRRKEACSYESTRFEDGFMIRSYNLGPFSLEYELDKWSVFSADIDRLRGAYMKTKGGEKRIRLKFNIGPPNDGSLD